MSLFKGRLDSGNKFTANDDIRGLELIAPGTAPAYFTLETGDGVKWSMWFDNSDNLRKHTTAPTTATVDSAGSVMFGASNAGMSTNMSNAATTVAFSETFVSDTNVTDDLGTSSIYWNDCYLGGKVYLSSTVTLDAGAGSRLDIVGDVLLGVDAAGQYMTFYSTDTGGYMKWDADGAGGAGSLLFTDDASLLFGDGSDFIIEWDATNLTMDCKTDNTGVIAIGGSKDTDVLFNGATASSDMLWDASADSLILYDDVVLKFGDDSDFTISWNATNLVLDCKTDNTGVIAIGSTKDTDVEFHGADAAYDMIWDASASDLSFLDGSEIRLGTADDLIFSFADPVVTATSGGTDSEFVLVNYAAQTTAMLMLDGATSTWNGADDVGQLWISQDAAMAHAGATMLLVETSAQPIAAAQGFMARYVATGTATASTWGVAIEGPATQGSLWMNGIVTHIGQDSPGAYIFQLTANDDTGNTGALDIHASGTDPALRVTGDEDDTPMASFICAANTDVSTVLIDGDTAGWLGADAVGMVHLQNDIAGGHANASLLLIDKSASIAEVNSALGSCFRIVENMDVAGSGTAYAAYIKSTNNAGLGFDINGDGVPAIDVDVDGDCTGAVVINILSAIDSGASDTSAVVITADSSGTGNQAAIDYTCIDEAKSYFAIFRNATTAWTSAKDPETHAEAGWIKIEVNGTAFFIPYYAAS